MLLHDETPYEYRPKWQDLLSQAGVSGVNPRRGLRFNQFNLALEAAIDGQGVAFTLKPLAEDDIASGRLVIPFDLRLPLPYAYYMVTLESVANQSRITAFREWILSEANIQTSRP